MEASAFYTWVLHWHTQDGFPELAKSAGLQTSAILDADGGRLAPMPTSSCSG